MGDARIRIVDHDPAWRRAFTAQRDELQTLLAPWLAGAVEHVGSTSVPGLAAKPVVDIAAPVRSFVDAQRALPVLESAGWWHWPDDPNASWRMWFLRPHPERRTHHLYLIQHDDVHLRELLAFRDRLRADAELRDRYADLKRILAERHSDDREAYTAAKAGFVAESLLEAGITPQPRPDPPI